MFTTLPILAIATVLQLCFRGVAGVGEDVQTSSGVVKGHASDWQPEVSEYLGIPYAKPPIGELRFMPPEPLNGEGNIIEASQFGDDCPSWAPAKAAEVFSRYNDTITKAVLTSIMQVGRPMSEDCLTLNIWTKPQTGEKAKAVLLWLPGAVLWWSDLTAGGTAGKISNGARLAGEQDIVVVTANYRTNVFGFPNAPGLTENNLGTLDQRKALEWVRDNIEAFGGDPKRIVMMGGTSAGAAVDNYAHAWADDPIVHGFIVQSSTWELYKMPPLSDTTPFGFLDLSERLGCGNEAAGMQGFNCVKTKSMVEILDPLRRIGEIRLVGLEAFYPTPDGHVVLDGSETKPSSFAKLPLLVGNNIGAAEIAVVVMPLGNLGFGFLGLPYERFPLCWTGRAARRRAENGVKVWQYRYYGAWPNLMLGADVLSPHIGAWDGSELPMIFGTTEYLGTGIPDTPEEAETSKMMMKAWATFVKDPVNGLSKLGWPSYNQLNQTSIGLGFNNQSDIVLEHSVEEENRKLLLTGNCTNFLGIYDARPGMAERQLTLRPDDVARHRR